MLINPYIVHTNLQATASATEIKQLCEEAKQHNFYCVCVPPMYVKKAKLWLEGSNIRVSTAIGYPMGFSAIEAKVAEAVLAIIDGADTIEMVINLCALKSNDWQYLANELNNILSVVKNNQKQLTIVLESGALTQDEIIKCCDLYGIAGIDCMKTSTEIAPVGASADAIKLIRKHLTNTIKIEASGGIKNYIFAKTLIESGADKIATCFGIQIINETGNPL
jgi:deoxyribose-phosphate aldolase